MPSKTNPDWWIKVEDLKALGTICEGGSKSVFKWQCVCTKQYSINRSSWKSALKHVHQCEGFLNVIMGKGTESLQQPMFEPEMYVHAVQHAAVPIAHHAPLGLSHLHPVHQSSAPHQQQQQQQPLPPPPHHPHHPHAVVMG